MSVERARKLIEKRDGRPFREAEPMERPTEAIKRYQALVEGAEDGESDLVCVLAYIADRETEVARLNRVIVASDVLAKQQIERREAEYKELADREARLRAHVKCMECGQGPVMDEREVLSCPAEEEVERLREEKQELLDVALGAYRSAGVWGKPVIGAAILRAFGPPWKW